MASPGSIVVQLAVKADKARRDVLDFAKSLGQVQDAGDDVDGSLKDVQRALDRTGTDASSADKDLGRTETALDQVGDEADRTADRLRRAATDMAGAVRTGAQKIDAETDHIRADMSETGREAGSELVGNIAEGVGSGTGTINDAVQGTLGGLVNLASSIGGPIGVAAAAAATGIGVIFSKVNEEANKIDEAVQNLITSLEEVGETASTTAQNIIWDEWMAGMRDQPAVLEDISQGLDQIGISHETWAKAIKGDVQSQQDILAALDAQEAQIRANQTAGIPLTRQQKERLENIRVTRGELEKQQGVLGTTKDELKVIDRFTQQTKTSSEDWAAEQEKVYQETHKIKGEYDGIKNKDVKLSVWAVDQNGNKLSRGQWDKLFGGQQSYTPPSGPTVAPHAATQVVNVRIDGIQDPYAASRLLSRQLEQYAKVQGRRSAERAISW